MTPASQRVPTTGQRQVLVTLMMIGNGGARTAAIHAKRDELAQKLHGVSIGTIASTFENLRECHRHGWIEPEVQEAAGKNKYGEHIAWHLNGDGRQAIERAQKARAEQQAKEAPVEGTIAPPTTQAPWTDDPEVAAEDPATELGDPEALEELDEEEVDGELEEPDDEDDSVPVNEGSNQLSLAIGGPKPKSSILKIMSKQQKFGTTRQFKNMERIPFSGYLEARGVAVDVQANGFVQRLQKAVISELVIDGVDVSDNDE